MFAFGDDVARIRHFGHKALLLFQPAHEDARAPVDKFARQRQMQGVGEAVLHLARAPAPFRPVRHPSAAVRDIGPGPHIGETTGKLVDIAFGPVQLRDLARDPVGGYSAVRRYEKPVYLSNQCGVFADRYFAKVRYQAAIPQPPHRRAAMGHVLNFRVAPERAERDQVVRVPRPAEARMRRLPFKRGHQRRNGAEIERGVAPFQRADGHEAMLHDRQRGFVIQRRGVAGDAERSVRLVPPGPARDLRDLGGGELPVAAAVEFGETREGDMFQVEIQAHADGVGRHQVLDIPVLIKRDLRVACAGRQRPHHHRCAALLPPYQLSDCVDLIGREGDDSRPCGQAADFLDPGVGQGGQPGPRGDPRARQQRLNAPAHGVGAQKQRLPPPARAQQPVGKDMAAVRVGAKLDLVHRDEIRAPIQRHRLHRAEVILSGGRRDLFFARQQGD